MLTACKHVVVMSNRALTVECCSLLDLPSSTHIVCSCHTTSQPLRSEDESDPSMRHGYQLLSLQPYSVDSSFFAIASLCAAGCRLHGEACAGGLLHVLFHSSLQLVLCGSLLGADQ